jgi:hypothetical protein
MEQHSVAALYDEQHAGNPATIEVDENLEQRFAHRTTGRHTDRPANLPGAPPYEVPVGAAVEVTFEEVAPGQLIHEWEVVV